MVQYDGAKPLFYSLNKALNQIPSCKTLLEGIACKTRAIPTSLLSTMWISIYISIFLSSLFFYPNFKDLQNMQGRNKLGLYSAVDDFFKKNLC